MTLFDPPSLFKSLADDTRARLALLLASEGELCVCELVCALEASQPKISRHLGDLRKTGLLQDRRQGQWVYYRLHDDLPAWVRHVLDVVRSANQAWMEDGLKRLGRMDDRPIRQPSCC